MNDSSCSDNWSSTFLSFFLKDTRLLFASSSKVSCCRFCVLNLIRCPVERFLFIFRNLFRWVNFFISVNILSFRWVTFLYFSFNGSAKIVQNKNITHRIRVVLLVSNVGLHKSHITYETQCEIQHHWFLMGIVDKTDTLFSILKCTFGDKYVHNYLRRVPRLMSLNIYCTCWSSILKADHFLLDIFVHMDDSSRLKHILRKFAELVRTNLALEAFMQIMTYIPYEHMKLNWKTVTSLQYIKFNQTLFDEQHRENCIFRSSWGFSYCFISAHIVKKLCEFRCEYRTNFHAYFVRTEVRFVC